MKYVQGMSEGTRYGLKPLLEQTSKEAMAEAIVRLIEFMAEGLVATDAEDKDTLRYETTVRDVLQIMGQGPFAWSNPLVTLPDIDDPVEMFWKAEVVPGIMSASYHPSAIFDPETETFNIEDEAIKPADVIAWRFFSPPMIPAALADAWLDKQSAADTVKRLFGEL